MSRTGISGLHIADRNTVRLGGVIAIVGAAALTFVALDDPVSERLGFSLPLGLYTFLLITGVLLTIWGVVLIVHGCLPRNVIVISFRRPTDANYEAAAVSRKELPVIREFSTQFFGNEVTELRKMEQLHKVNPYIFWKIVEARQEGQTETRTIVGYYCLIPLKKEATRLVEDEELNGTMFTTQHIVKHRPGGRRALPTSIYLGGIAAIEKGKTARAATLKRLQEHVESEYRLGVKLMYTRPITNPGLELAKARGCKAVDPQAEGALNRIYRLTLDELKSDGNTQTQVRTSPSADD